MTDEAYDPSAPALFSTAGARTPEQRTNWRTVPQAAAAERLAALKEDAAFRRELQKVRQRRTAAELTRSSRTNRTNWKSCSPRSAKS